MHISEGVLSAPVLVTGAAVSIVCLGIGLKKIDEDRIPLIAVLSSAFFVASLIHVPVGPSSIHLVLNGICGLLLGWAAFPAIIVALFLQAVLFQFGGLTTLGVNTVIMAFPSILCFYIFNWLVKKKEVWIWTSASFACGALSIFASGLLVAVALVSTGEPFMQAAQLVVLAHIPVMIIEGLMTSFCIAFLKKVKPQLLEVAHERQKNYE
jgi:cobalt/nickel transport system permease protein